MILETERTYLRKIEQSDFSALCKILQDKEVMYAYEHAFSCEEVQEWLDKQLKRYNEDGFGLWAVILTDTNEMIGQCGITMQEYKNKKVPEIGYLFQKAFWHQGYAAETAVACKEYAFNVLNIDEVYSIIRDNNITSQNVAKKNGMTIKDEFVDNNQWMMISSYPTKHSITIIGLKKDKYDVFKTYQDSICKRKDTLSKNG